MFWCLDQTAEFVTQWSLFIRDKAEVLGGDDPRFQPEMTAVEVDKHVDIDSSLFAFQEV